MKGYWVLVFFLIVLVSCVNHNQSEEAIVESVTGSVSKEIQQEEVEKLIERKALIDTLIIQSNLQVEVLAQQPNRDELVVVLNENFPEEVERTYNIWKDSEGKIVLIGEYPYSESGDWYIEYKHYFNDTGETFAFERRTNFFNSICTDDVAYEVITDYYDAAFRKLHQVYSLTDLEGDRLNKEECEFHYDYPYKVSQNLEAYLKRIQYRVK